MHQHIKVKTTVNQQKETTMNQAKTVKTIVALLAIILIALTITSSAAQTSLPLKVDHNHLSERSPSKRALGKNLRRRSRRPSILRVGHKRRLFSGWVL